MWRQLIVFLVAACAALRAPPSRPRALGRRVAGGGPRASPDLSRRATETEGEVFELLEDDDGDGAAAAAMMRGDDDDDDDDDTQQARVVSYMVLSLLPILALLPFFGSRDWLPADPSLYT
jgi:hypothetical protein